MGDEGDRETKTADYIARTLINNTTFAIIGLVSAREHDTEMLTTIDARADAMAATVHTEE